MCDGYDINSIGVSVPQLTHLWHLPGPAFTTTFLWSSIGILVGALVVGMVDTLGRAFLKPTLSTLIGPSAADNAGPAVASMLIYLLMAAVLFWKPRGLFPSHG